ncbi:hypothetical protein [Nannocystis bainbridge]|uniref:Uncharacterized protein n=1 Tax=Nannocystis bainbridge TaxID=2995303 RepID=A0ABT5DW09_9BACT|nr:hypothetical protein [Nannocystis bainbridge]MDC0717750.1 hypothetical protein [Nannocystis bainbridge]
MLAFVTISMAAASCDGCDGCPLGWGTDSATGDAFTAKWLSCDGNLLCVPHLCGYGGGYTEEELCAYHYFGHYPQDVPGGWNAEYGASCDWYNEAQIITPCAENSHPPSLPNNDPTTSDGGSETGGTETEGPEESGTWYCKWDENLEIGARDMCFYFMKTDEMTDAMKRAEALADPANHRKCWQELGTAIPCGMGTKSEAAMECAMDCAMERKNREDGLFSDESVLPEQDTWDCSTTFFDSHVHLHDPDDGKAFCNYVMPVWGGDSSIKSFTATLSVAGSDGGSSSQTGLQGYLAMKAENCTATKCDLVIDAMEMHSTPVIGIYTDAAGAQYSYEIWGADFQLAEELQGEWYLARGSVTFPLDSAVLRGWAEGASILDIPVPDVGPLLSMIQVEQLSGTLRDDVLSLTMSYTHEGTLGVLSLVTN